MKYKCTVQIKAPIDQVVELWENEDHFHEWQDDFESIELLEGVANVTGAKSKIIYNGKMRIELIETIMSYNLPTEKSALYEHVHMTNTQVSCFESLDNGQTLYTSEVEYLKFNGLMPKMAAFLFPSKFKGQSQKWMNQFKAFVERKIAV